MRGSGSMSAALLKGVFTPVVTPFRIDRFQSPHMDGLHTNLHSQFSGSANGIVLFGSTGEFVSLSGREKANLIANACTRRDAVDANKKIIVGVGNEGCEVDIYNLSVWAKKKGCNAVMVLPPHYYPQHQSEKVVTAFFKRVADSSPLPVIIYSIPKCVGFEVPFESVRELAKHENVIGIKDSSGDAESIKRLLSVQSEKFSVLTGSAVGLLEHVKMGVEGGILAVANVAAGLCDKVIREKKEEDQRKLVRLHKALQDRTGGQIALIKHALDLQGLFGGFCRDPLPRSAEPDEMEALKPALKELELIK